MSSQYDVGRDAPIGVFDSGVGGLSVLKQVIRKLPEESVLYFGDTCHVPYGGRPLDEVRGFALNICRYLASNGAKMIVMACNISSAVAIDDARRLFPHIPILGVIEPGASAAIATTAKNIGVLATQGTVSSGAYTRVIHRISPTANVVEVACPAFVPIVEAEKVNTTEAYEVALEYLAPLVPGQASAVILGCTHYPFLLDTLISAASELFPVGAVPTFIDPAIETANAIAGILNAGDIGNRSGGLGYRKYSVSGSSEHFEQNGSFFLGQAIRNAQQVTL